MYFCIAIMIRRLYWSLLILSVFGCTSRKDTYTQLVAIDSLLINEQVDSALHLLKTITPTELDEKGYAYYNLLKTQALYKAYLPISSDSMINLAINYYEQSGDNNKLARSLFYKAGVLTELNIKTDALKNLKEAERVIDGSEDYLLKHNIYYLIASTNYDYQEQNIALKYIKKAIDCSEKTKRIDHLAYDYEKISIIFFSLNQRDSCLSYINRYINMIHNVPEIPAINRARMWGNIGSSLLPIDEHKAKLYLEKANSLVPQDNVYGALAEICLNNKDTLKAITLLNDGLAISKNNAIKIKLYQWLSRIEQETGNYKRANELLHEAQALKDSMAKKQQEDNIRAQQIEYDWMVEQKQTDREFLYALLAIIGVVLASGALTWYLLNRKRKAERKMKKEEAENSELKEIIFTKTEELKSANKELRSVSKKVQKLEAHQKEAKKEQRAKEKRLARGHQLYTELISGGNIILWKRQDIMDMVAYYRQVDPDFANRTDSNYENLTPSELLLLILEHIGKDDEEIMSIMNLNENAFRTLRFRTRQQGR